MREERGRETKERERGGERDERIGDSGRRANNCCRYCELDTPPIQVISKKGQNHAPIQRRKPASDVVSQKEEEEEEKREGKGGGKNRENKERKGKKKTNQYIHKIYFDYYEYNSGIDEDRRERVQED